MLFFLPQLLVLIYTSLKLLIKCSRGNSLKYSTSFRYMLPIKSHGHIKLYPLFFFFHWIGKICFQKWKDIWGNVCQRSHCGVSRFHHGRNHHSRYKSDPNKDSSSIWCVNIVELIFELLIQKYALVLLISNSVKFQQILLYLSTLSIKCWNFFFKWITVYEWSLQTICQSTVMRAGTR